jgi:hypothetical protein
VNDYRLAALHQVQLRREVARVRGPVGVPMASLVTTVTVVPPAPAVGWWSRLLVWWHGPPRGDRTAARGGLRSVR